MSVESVTFGCNGPFVVGGALHVESVSNLGVIYTYDD